MLIIISLDSVFFIFPYVFHFMGWFCFKCYDSIKKLTSKNNVSILYIRRNFSDL